MDIAPETANDEAHRRPTPLRGFVARYLSLIVMGVLTGALIGPIVGSILPFFGTFVGLVVGAVQGGVIMTLLGWLVIRKDQSRILRRVTLLPMLTASVCLLASWALLWFGPIWWPHAHGSWFVMLVRAGYALTTLEYLGGLWSCIALPNAWPEPAGERCRVCGSEFLSPADEASCRSCGAVR